VRRAGKLQRASPCSGLWCITYHYGESLLYFGAITLNLYAGRSYFCRNEQLLALQGRKPKVLDDTQLYWRRCRVRESRSGELFYTQNSPWTATLRMLYSLPYRNGYDDLKGPTEAEMQNKVECNKISASLWTARIIPIILAGTVGYATYVLVAILSGNISISIGFCG
jgi:hypothetical protein